MREAFSLALAVRGTTLPNPAVGCLVLDRTGKLLSKAATNPGGRPHAERQALEKAGAKARGGTLYVTLEPCVAFPGKKSPPCAAACILSGVETVVVGSRDPNPLVSGRGIHALRKAGIKVVEEPLGGELPDFYAGFGHFLATKRPLVRLKVALSSDGMVAHALGHRTAITGDVSRAFVHRLRAASDAILVGGATARIDNPALTVRDAPGRSPARFVLWSSEGLPQDLALFAPGGPSTTVVGVGSRPASLAPSATWLELPGRDGRPSLEALLVAMGDRGFHDLLVEPGPRLARSFWDLGLGDEWWSLRSPEALVDGVPLGLDFESLERVSSQHLGRDEATLWRRRAPIESGPRSD